MFEKKLEDGRFPQGEGSLKSSMPGDAEERKGVYVRCLYTEDPFSEDRTIGYTKVKSIVFLLPFN